MPLFEFSGRQRPVSLPPALVEGLASQRVTGLVLPSRDHAGLRAGDALWLREGVTVDALQPRRNELRFAYAGFAGRHRVRWPAGQQRPPAGWMRQQDVPVGLSRFTLVVEEVRHLFVGEIDADFALRCGVSIEHGGFGVMGFPFMRPFQSELGALRFLVDQLDRGSPPNPQLCCVGFRAVQRNIADFVISGGV